eukprot:6197941-Pleurochrysis_carterae.AAC.2
MIGSNSACGFYVLTATLLERRVVRQAYSASSMLQALFSLHAVNHACRDYFNYSHMPADRGAR